MSRTLCSQSCLTRPTLIDLSPSELCYYPFVIGLDRCVGSCNTCNNLVYGLCVSNKTEIVKNMDKMITETFQKRKKIANI